MTTPRKMTPREVGLVKALLADHPDHAFAREHLGALDVEEMSDGGMGSLRCSSPVVAAPLGLRRARSAIVYRAPAYDSAA